MLQDLGRLLGPQVREVEDPLVQNPALAHHHQAQTQPLPGLGQAHRVQVPAAGQDRGLAFHGAAHGPDAVAQQRGLLETQALGRCLHLALELGQHALHLAREEALHPPHQFGIGPRLQLLDAGRQALAQVVVQAGPGAVAQGPVRTGAQGEDARQQAPGLAGGLGRGERSEIERAVALHPAGDAQPGKGRALVQAEQEVLLVVAQDHVVARPVLLDQALLQEQGLLLAGGGQHVHTEHAGHQGPGLGREPGRSAEIGGQAAAQALGLAHIEDAALSILHKIDARRVRKVPGLKMEEGLLRLRGGHGLLLIPVPPGGNAQKPGPARSSGLAAILLQSKIFFTFPLAHPL